MDFLKQLNTEQRKAVTHKEGPLLIVAGAGTGKTTVITQRIAWLIAQGNAKSDEILAVTFTDKAAGEMEERVDRLLPLGYLDLWISTFHAFCQRVLQEHAIDIGLPRDVKLLDQTSQWLLVRQNLDRFNLDYYRPLGNPTKFIHALLKHFSRAKDEAIRPEEYIEYVEGLRLDMDTAESTGGKAGGTRNHESLLRKGSCKQTGSMGQKKSENKNIKENLTSNTPVKSTMTTGYGYDLEPNEIVRLEEIANAYHTYQQILLENSVMDFGDLINYTLKLFKERPNILKEYQQKFKYILVDEFQDTNWAQYELIKLLAAPKNNITMVGDDEQSIYKFRGASVSNIMQFHKDYPEAKFVTLIINYRSKQRILDTSHEFIQLNNPNRLEGLVVNGKKIDKKLKAYNKGTGSVEYLLFNDQYDEASGVATKIEKILQQASSFIESGLISADKQDDSNAVTYNDFAVLIRANSQADAFIHAFEANGIPYQFVASRGLYTKRIILDIINFLKLLDDYHESPSLWRTLNWPVFNFKVRTLVGINHFAKKKSMSLYQALHHFQNFTPTNPPLVRGGLRGGPDDSEREEIKRVITLIEHHTKLAQEKKPREVILHFLEESGYLKYLTNKQDAYSHQQVKYLEQFDKKLKGFESSVPDPSVKLFLEELQMELDSGQEGSLEVDLDSGPEAVKIMTIHAAKGLEFSYVFIVNMVDKRFPALDRRDPIELPDELVKEVIPEGDIHIQEERRLFYVALTRAKECVFLTAAEDYGGKTKKKPSRFIHELGLIDKEIRVETVKEVSESNKFTNKLTVFRHELPARFSFTQMEAFRKCPYQYRFAHVLKVPIRANYQLSYGKTMHATLKRFVESFKERQDLDQGELFSQEIQKQEKAIPSLKELLGIYEEEWIDDWYENAEAKEKYFKMGKESLAVFHKKVLKNPPATVYLEQGFNLKIQDPITNKYYSIRGQIDRVDLIDDDEVEIIDYKTGTPKSEITSDIKDQLLIYQIAANEALGLKPVKLTYYYLDNNKPLSFLGTEDEVNKLKARIIEFVEKVKESQFKPDPSTFKCKYCDYRNICEYRQL